MFGAGPTGLVLAQMLRQNGGCHVVVAAPEGLKMDLAKKLEAGDVRIKPDHPKMLCQLINLSPISSFLVRTQKPSLTSSKRTTLMVLSMFSPLMLISMYLMEENILTMSLVLSLRPPDPLRFSNNPLTM